MKEGLFRSISIVSIATFFLIGLQFPGRSTAVVPLESFRDVINDTTPGRTNVAHDLYFVLPANAQQITPSDYIQIQFHQFSNVTAATGVSGGFGTPTFGVTGNTVTLTNFAMLPGTGLGIQGIFAQNPSGGQAFNVTIKITEDASGTIVRNQSTTFASPSGNQMTVSATVETVLSAVHMSGFTSPGAFVTLSENISVAGTTVADGAGYFAFPISGLTPGDHIYSIFSTDSNGFTTSQSTLQTFLLAGTLTSTSGIILSPSIAASPGDINPGDPLLLFGTGKPNSQINIFVESPLRSYQATTDNAGAWTYTVDSTETTTYNPGQYRANVNVQDGIGNQSIVSPSINFTVGPDNTIGNPAPACDISRGDLNCDNITSLVDFSILIFHWNTNHRVADINSDTRVNLIDFSIMMFYYQ